MGWRQRFDPARARLDMLRERAKRIRDIRSLGAQVAQVRRVGLRGEVLVPIIAVLILIVTLALSALAPDSPDTLVDVGSTTTSIALAPSSTVIIPTPSAAVGSGYPLASGSPTAVSPDALPTIGATDGLTGTDTLAEGQVPTDGYPAPDGQPQGVGEPPSGDIPTSGFDQPTPAVVNPPVIGGPVVPPIQLAPTPQLGSGGYPAPAVPPARPPSTVTQPNTQRPTNQQPQPTAVPQGDSTGGDTGYPEPADDESTDVGEDETTAPTTGTAGSDGTVPTPSQGAPTVVPTASAQPTPTPLPPTPTPRPAKAITGNVRWTAANSPIVVTEDQVVVEGAFLTIEPGVEVRFAPDVRLTVAGTLRAGGDAAAPVRLIGPDGRWDGLVGTPGSTISMDSVALRQAGRNGTALSTSGGTLVVRNSTLSDSGGGIVALGSLIDLRGTQITGNALAGPAVNVVLPEQDGSVISGNIIGGNTTPQGAPQLLVTG